MKLKRKASVVAVALALSSPAVWAGVSSDAAQANETQNPGTQAAEQAAGSQSAMDGAKESLGWTYVNGQPAGSQDPAQAKPDDDGRTMSSQTADSQSDGSDQAASETTGRDYSSAKEGDQTRGDDSAAASGQQEEDLQAAKPDESDQQSAQSDEQSRDQTAKSQEDDDDQSAKSEDSDEDQSAATEDEDNGQSAQSDNSGKDQAADSGVPAGLEGKVIVIIPRDWQGSLKDLVAALENSPDAKDIVIVQQGDPQASNKSDEYFAEKPVSNEQGTQ